MGIRKALFGLSLQRVGFEALGFHIGNNETRERLEYVVHTFARSYNLALDDGDPARVGALIDDEVELEMRGFGHEAAAMAFAVLDTFRIGRAKRFASYAHEIRPGYGYLAYVGGGVACGALRRRCSKLRSQLDPFTSWLVLDGRGFYDGFFRTARTVRKHRVPRDIGATEIRQYDAGIGRGLWFIECGDPARIDATIAAFAEARRPHIWAGIGLAAAYAGGVSRGTLEELVSRAGEHRAMLAQGAALAAHARHRAGNSAPHVDLASQVIWQLSSAEIHALAERSIADVHSTEHAEPTWLAFVANLRRAFESAQIARVA